MTEGETGVQTHKGSCHCGAIAFEVDTDLSQVIECNCSHCYRKGLWLTFVEPDKFRVTSGEPQLTEYLFNLHRIHHLICPTCGVESFGRGENPSGKTMMAVNIRCLTDVQPFSVKPTMQFDGRNKL